MLVAVAITALGFLLVGLTTQLFGYRLGGTIAIPVLAVYTLKNVFMLPIFVLSTVLAYLGLSVVVGLMGIWLLWQDRRAAQAGGEAEISPDAVERTSG